MGALTIIFKANFHTYLEIVTEIFITVATHRERIIQVTLHCFLTQAT